GRSGGVDQHRRCAGARRPSRATARGGDRRTSPDGRGIPAVRSSVNRHWHHAKGRLMLVSVPVRRLAFFALAVLVVLCVSRANAGTLAPEDDEPFLPGLTATYRDATGTTVARLDHQLSFHWGDSAPDPRLARGEFNVTWRGNLQIVTKGDYRFFV